MTRAPLSHFAQIVADRDSITVDAAVRLLASDAGIRGANDLPIHALSRIVMVEHDDGSLESLTAEVVADAFACELRAQIGARAYRRVIDTNAANPDAGWCASHNHCDANMVMHAVMLRFGFDMESDWSMCDSADPIGVMWCAAWRIFRAGKAEVRA